MRRQIWAAIAVMSVVTAGGCSSTEDPGRRIDAGYAVYVTEPADKDLVEDIRELNPSHRLKPVGAGGLLHHRPPLRPADRPRLIAPSLTGEQAMAFGLSDD